MCLMIRRRQKPSYRRQRTSWSTADDIRVDTGLFLSRGMELPIEEVLDGAGAASGGLAVAAGSNFGALDSKSLIHDRASASNELEVRNGTAAGRLAGAGGQGAQGGGAGLVEEGADALGLVEESLHVDGKADNPKHWEGEVTMCERREDGGDGVRGNVLSRRGSGSE